MKPYKIGEVRLTVGDKAGNTATANWSFTLDTTPPEVKINSPLNGTEFYSDQNLTIDYNVTDVTSGIASFSTTLDGAAIIKGNLIDLRNLSIGSHTIRVTAINEIIPVTIKPNETEEDGKDDKDGVLENDDSELKVKFNRTQVQSIINLGDVTLYISGKVNGAAFLGNYTIRVIENKKIESEKETEKSENDKKKDGKSS